MSTLKVTNLQHPSSSGNNLTFYSDGTVKGHWVRGTATSVGTSSSHTYTGIPADVSQVIVQYENLSMTANDYIYFRFGPSGGVETSGYAWATNGNDNDVIYNSTTNMWFINMVSPGNFYDVQFHYTRLTNNKWQVFAFATARNSSGTGVNMFTPACGSLDLSGSFERVEVYVTSGNLDSGEVTVHYTK